MSEPQENPWWDDIKDDPTFRQTLIGQSLTAHEQLQILEREMKRQMGPVVYHLVYVLFRLLQWMRICR